VSLYPLSLAFFLGQVFALVYLVMASLAQSSDQVVIGLNAPALTAAPIGVGCLHHITRPASLAVQTGHQL
jgi:hypothetical protein